MRYFLIYGVILLTFSNSSKLFAEGFWPGTVKAAVNLAYDDAIASQLDHAAPALNRHGFKGSFYLTLSSPVLYERMQEWRKLAEHGHELGNHSIFHPCDASLPGRDWVAPYHDMSKRSIAQVQEEFRVASSFLHAIDSKRDRTLTVPCGDIRASGVDYIDKIKANFLAIKTVGRPLPTSMEKVDIHRVGGWGPESVSGSELIDYVKRAAEAGTMANFTFHGIGGDYLSVSKKAHRELLSYLDENRQVYWVDTFMNIMTYTRKKQQELESPAPKTQAP